jgi:hypothetical protein
MSEKYQYPLMLPVSLAGIVKLYAQRREISFNRAMIELLERSPQIVELYAELTGPVI